MAEDTVQQIKDRLSIVDVVSGYVKLERSGASLRARCPFHTERTPSFHVSADRGTYHCFGCNVGGDIFSFVQAIEGVDFKGALKILAERAGVPLDFTRGSESGSKDDKDLLFEAIESATIFYVSKMDDIAREYLTKRGLDSATIKAFRLGYSGNAWSDAADHLKSKGFAERVLIEAGLAKKNERGGLLDKFRNRIMFPIADSAGRIVAFSGRSFGEHASPEAPKYLNSSETPLYHKSRILYGFDRAKLPMRKNQCAILVEGQMDLLMSHQAGWSNAVAVSGTAFTAEHATLIKRMTENLVLALDADEAGIKAAARAARVALSQGLNVKVAQLPRGLDPADLILQEGTDAWSTAIRDSKDIITFLLDVLEERSQKADAFRRSVEMIVLPFLSDVRSPIAREQYVREVAQRLGVSEMAVTEALAKVPRGEMDERMRTDISTEASAPTSESRVGSRERAAFALLLWQESLAKPLIDVQTYARELEDALGADAFAILRGLREEEQEHLRFEAERTHGKSTKLQNESHMLARLLLQQQFSDELTDNTAALRRAEAHGDEEGGQQLLEQSRVLTTRLAQLREKV